MHGWMGCAQGLHVGCGAAPGSGEHQAPVSEYVGPDTPARDISWTPLAQLAALVLGCIYGPKLFSMHRGSFCCSFAYLAG